VCAIVHTVMSCGEIVFSVSNYILVGEQVGNPSHCH